MSSLFDREAAGKLIKGKRTHKLTQHTAEVSQEGTVKNKHEFNNEWDGKPTYRTKNTNHTEELNHLAAANLNTARIETPSNIIRVDTGRNRRRGTSRERQPKHKLAELMANSLGEFNVRSPLAPVLRLRIEGSVPTSLHGSCNIPSFVRHHRLSSAERLIYILLNSNARSYFPSSPHKGHTALVRRVDTTLHTIHRRRMIASFMSTTALIYFCNSRNKFS